MPSDDTLPSTMNQSKVKQGTSSQRLSSLDSLLEDKRESTSTLRVESGELRRDDSEEILIKHNIKKLSSWFPTWYTWQKRLLICSVMNCCSKQQLVVLATSLEPILHMDFSSSLFPPLQALHLDGVALFHIQRGVMRKIAKPEVVPDVDSRAYLNSLPSTFLSTNTEHPSKSTVHGISSTSLGWGETSYHFSLKKPLMEPVQTQTRSSDTRKKKESILPAMPLTHPGHLPTPRVGREVSFNQLLGLRRQRFSSVPDFHSTTELLKSCGKTWGDERKRSPGRALLRRKTISAYYTRAQSWEQRTEQFKEQLAQVTDWMNKWGGTYKSYLLSVLVKLCDKNLLGYFVQCLHQQLQDNLGITSLPHSVLMRILFFLSPKDLCRASQVCRDWNVCANVSDLWKSHAYQLGVTEGMGNIVEVMESVIKHYKHSLCNAGQGEMVDWKRAYRDLGKLVVNMKNLVITNVEESEKGEVEEQLILADKNQTRNNLTLLDMLVLLRCKCSKSDATTHQLYLMAPENSSTTRRKLRAERKAEDERMDEEEVEERIQSHRVSLMLKSGPVFHPGEAWTPTHNLEFAQHLMMNIRDTRDPHYEQFLKKYNIYEGGDLFSDDKGSVDGDRIDVALDTRPRAPTLPNPNAIRCLILAGGLLGSHTPRPGRIVDISRLRRLNNVGCITMCMQCDSRKIVTGSSDRTISVTDIRSGRPIAKLHGHKGSVHCLQYDDYKIVSGSWDTTCIVWDVIHFKMLKQLNGHMECVSCLQFDEDILVTGSHDGSLRVWSTSNWEILSVITSAHFKGVFCLKMNDRLIVSGGIDKKVKVWSVSTYHCLKVLEHNAPITTLALSHLLLVSCAMDGEVILWNLDKYKPIVKIRTNNETYLKQLAQFRTKYYGAGSDGLLYELDISTGTCSRTLTGHNLVVTAIWVVGHILVSASADKTIVTWYFKGAARAVAAKRDEESEEGEGEGEEGEEVESDSSSDTNLKGGYRYRPPKFYTEFPFKVVVEERIDWCCFVYDQ